MDARWEKMTFVGRRAGEGRKATGSHLLSFAGRRSSKRMTSKLAGGMLDRAGLSLLTDYT